MSLLLKLFLNLIIGNLADTIGLLKTKFSRSLQTVRTSLVRVSSGPIEGTKGFSLELRRVHLLLILLRWRKRTVRAASWLLANRLMLAETH